MTASGVFLWIESRAERLLILVLVLTAILAVPFLLLSPDAEASMDPPGEVFEAQDLIDDRLVSPLFTPVFVVEARGGDLLLKEPLLELLSNEAALRAGEAAAGTLYSFLSADYRSTVHGLYTIADAIDKHLRDSGFENGLAGATDELVKVAAYDLLQPGEGTEVLGDLFSIQSTTETRRVDGREIEWRTIPALMFVVLADNDQLGGGGYRPGIGGDEADIEKEEFARDALELLRGEERTFRLWGVGIDSNLTSADEGVTAGPFVTFTIIVVLLVVGFVFRSYWSVAVVGAALAILMIWLGGIANLVGIENSIVMSFIVPIAMISFGVDFAFHAVGRYREEAARGHVEPGRAYVAGLTAVSAALLLALLSDSLAFLANMVSGIPAIIQFGLGASIALSSAYFLLGVLTPLALTRIESDTSFHKGEALSRRAAVVGLTALAALAAGFTVLFLIFFPPIGVAALLVYLVTFVVVPYVRSDRSAQRIPAEQVASDDGRWEWVGSVVAGFGRGRFLILPVAALLTVFAAWGALKVEASFDVKDFFSSDSDYVVGVDKLGLHSSAGESALVYVEGDLTDPRSLEAIRQTVEAIDASNSGRFGRLATGEIQVSAGVLDLVEEVMSSTVAVAAIGGATGADLSDADGDGLPDSATAIEAIYRFALEGGVPGEGGFLVAPVKVPSEVWFDQSGETQASLIEIGLTGTRQQENVGFAREELEPILAQLEAGLSAVNADAKIQITGSPIIRQEGLDSVVRALQTSLPVAMVLCLLVAAVFMRSLRFAIVAIIPILLVVVWLYGLMYLFGFPLNAVTATIGAISIGVGIDFATHFTMRYREELRVVGTRIEAVQRTGAGTGAALVASAFSSMAAFAVMSLAPMPMFATYGLLTAIMIALAAAASLIVLPALLVIITRDRERLAEA